MSDRYILVGHEPVREPDLFKWARWLDSAERHVKLTEQDDVRVSTVFLGIDHSWDDDRPILFETMVFIDGDGGEMDRYATWDEAVEGHDRIVATVLAARPILALPK